MVQNPRDNKKNAILRNALPKSKEVKKKEIMIEAE